MAKKHTINAEFEIGDVVFVKLPESDPYLITNIIANIGLKAITYELMGVMGEKIYCKAREISKERVVF